MIDRRLTLELLRLAVKEKVLGAYDRNWKGEHWDHLEQMVEDVRRNLKASGQKVDPPAGDRRWFVAFLNQSDTEIKKFRNHPNPRAGRPVDNNLDYLVRILDIGLDGILAFERRVTALGLHPDHVQQDQVSILTEVQTIRDASTARPESTEHSTSGSHKSTHTTRDATIPRDPFKQEAVMTASAIDGHPTDFEVPEDIGSEQPGNSDSGQPAPSKSRLKPWIIASIVPALGLLTYVLWPLLHPRAPTTAPAKPLIDIRSYGHNSPPIYSGNGDVYFWGSVQASDSFIDTTVSP